LRGEQYLPVFLGRKVPEVTDRVDAERSKREYAMRADLSLSDLDARPDDSGLSLEYCDAD
jgi:hypothetical protein